MTVKFLFRNATTVHYSCMHPIERPGSCALPGRLKNEKSHKHKRVCALDQMLLFNHLFRKIHFQRDKFWQMANIAKRQGVTNRIKTPLLLRGCQTESGLNSSPVSLSTQGRHLTKRRLIHILIRTWLPTFSSQPRSNLIYTGSCIWSFQMWIVTLVSSSRITELKGT